ncbi:MAG: dihydroorotate dehydrogenase, partial [candidate division WOR-3 bacterium]
MAIRLFGQYFNNPVFLASGVYGYGLDFPEVVEQVGAIFTKGITKKPRVGNPPPRLIEVTAGAINSVGLENVGIDAFIKKILPKLKKSKIKIFVNIAGNSIE